MSIEDFISGLDIETREDMVDENGDPRKDVEIHESKLICHPSVVEKLKEGIRIMMEHKIMNYVENKK